MRQADGSDLLGTGNPHSASIGIIYVAPTDDRSSVLEAIFEQDKIGRKQVAVVLSENSRAFQRAVDFDGLKNLRRGLKTEIIFVIPGAPGPADLARQRRFTVYTSLDNYTSALRAQQPDNGNVKKGLPLFNRRPKLVPNANAPAPLERLDEPASPPLIVPVIPLGAPPPVADVPFEDDEVVTKDEPASVEPFVAAGGAGVTDTNVDTDDERMQPSPAAPQDSVPYAAPVVPVMDDEEIEPLRPRSKSGPIPIPIVMPQTGAATKPLNTGPRGANGSASPIRSGNTGKQAAIGAAAVGAGAAAAFAAASPTPTPVAGGGQPPIRGNTSGSGGGGGGGGRRPRRRSTRQLLLLLLVLLTLLLLAGIAFASPPGQSLIGHITGSTITATVTITPAHPTVSDSFVITAVTGKPNPAAQQVQARVVSYTSPSQSASANATGSIAGANATGILTFANIGNGVSVPGGILTAGNGVRVSFGSFFLPFGSVNIQGTAVNQGAAGNIPALSINGQCCGSSLIRVRNNNSFSGGRDPIPNSVITQNDITTASNNLVAKLKPSAQTALQKQLKPNEAAVSSSLNCTTNVSANHNVGDQATSVTVTGTATCTEVVYDQKGAIGMATDALKAEAAKNPGAGYALVGNVVTSVTSATVINKQNTVSLVILAQGVWVYQFTDAIKTSIKNKIAKEAQSKAQADVNGTTGVMSATISISSGSTMPDAADITINIVQIPGLSGSPTPTTTPPSGTTPTSTPALTPTNGLGNGATVTPTAVLGGS